MDTTWALYCAAPIVVSSSLVVWAGAVRSRTVRHMIEALLVAGREGKGAGGRDGLSDDGMGGFGPGQQQVLDSRGALLMPVMGSLTLVGFYFLFTQLQSVVMAYVMLASFASVSFVVMEPVRDGLLKVGWVAGRSFVQYVSACMAAVVVVLWLFTGHWALNNLLGGCITVSMISFIRLPNLRVAALCLGSLFVYDVFWVFYSASIFGQNVMVEVATKAAVNPASVVGHALGLPMLRDVPAALQPPLKLLFPYWPAGRTGPTAYSMLGLGDMAVPGLFAALALAFDDYLRQASEATKKHDDMAASSRRFQSTTDNGAHDTPHTRVCTHTPDTGTYTQVRTCGSPQKRSFSMSGASKHGALVVAASGAGVCSTSHGASMDDNECVWGEGVCCDVECGYTPTHTDAHTHAQQLTAYTQQWRFSYFTTAMIGYVVGVVASLMFSRAFRAAQPALLYIVPCTIGPIAVKAWRAGAGHLTLLWKGFTDKNHDGDDDEHTHTAPTTTSEEACVRGGGVYAGGNGGDDEMSRQPLLRLRDEKHQHAPVVII